MRSMLLTALFLLVTCALSVPAPGNDYVSEISVHPSQSIQQVIKDAKNGDKIVIEAGIYKEQLEITKDGIQLIGKPGAVLMAPDKYTKNFCTGTSKSVIDGSDGDAGICIHGDVKLGGYIQYDHTKVPAGGVRDYITGVVVTGLEIRNFSGESIAVYGGEGTRIYQNKLVDGGQYGFLSVACMDTQAWENTITSSTLGFIAMCMDDTSPAIFRNNDISNYFIALCTETSGGLVKHNTAKTCCNGVFIDPDIKGARVIGNTISRRNPNYCPPGPGAAAITISGAQDTIVRGNTLEFYQNDGTGLGIYVADGDMGQKATGNKFKNNVLRSNDLDIDNNATMQDSNMFKNNKCATSLPLGYCG